MTIEIAVVLAIVFLAFLLFVTEKYPIDVTAVFLLALLLVTGLLTPEEAISGYSNPAVITIALLFVLTKAIEKTHVLEYLVVKINRIFNRSMNLGLVVFLISIAIASALVNNTAIVAIFIPITIRIAQSYGMSPSKLLIPLSYAAILGGTMTLVGTSTNLLVNSIIVQDGTQTPLGMFEFAKFGIVMVSIGIIYLLLVSRRLLPSRTVTTSLTKSFHMGGFLTELKILKDSPLIGRTCLERSINHNYDVTVIDILRRGKHITSNIRNTVLEEDDILIVRGSLDSFLRMKEIERIAMLTDQKLNEEELEHSDNMLVELLITQSSDLIGKNLKEINFRRRFGSFVLAIRKEGALLRKKIAHVVLAAYDTLLVYGPRDKIAPLGKSGDFIVIEEISEKLSKHRFWWMSVTLILVIVILAALRIIPILKGALIAVAILWVLRLITPNDSYRAIRWQVIILIASLIPLGIVIQSSGTADWISGLLVKAAAVFPAAYMHYALLGLLYLLTMILTEISSNAATAIIMTPIAISLGAQVGLDARPFVFVICFAASASFITPVGYQTNLMVYGPGGYKFSDYFRVGFPLAVILWIVAIIVIPVLWPFIPV